MQGETASWTPGEDVAPLLTGTAGSSGNRLTDGFAAIEAEIAKLTSPTGQPVSWSVVGEEAEAYLKATAKDLRIATYLVMAWVHGKKVAGLRRGLDLLVGLLDGAWEQLHPPVEKLSARVGALTFLSEQLPRPLEAMLAGTIPEADGKALVDSFARYRDVVARRFAERPPALGPIEELFMSAQQAKRLPDFSKPETEAKAETGSEGGAAASSGDDDPMLKPISADAPAGQDPKLTDDFDALYTELDKIAAIDGGAVDWSLVRDTAAKILQGTGKDLRCLMYWSVARLHLEKIEGLADGLRTTVAVIERYGDDLFPKRPKARAGALGWLGARLEEDLPKVAKSAPEEVLTSLHKSIDAAEKAMGGRAKSLEGLQRARSALMGVKSIKPKPKPQPKPAVKPATGGTATAKPAEPAPPAAPVVPEELEGLVQQILDQANALAASGETAFSLRLRRQALWMAEPPVIKGRKFDCDSLVMKPRTELATLAKKEEWDELLSQTEELFPSYPFCLDLTYWAGLAAKEVIGEEASKALASELAALAIRAPQLLRGTDRKGQVLASKEARAWISEHRGTAPAAPAPAAAPAAPAATADKGAPASAPAAPAPSAAETLPEEIDKLFKNGQAAEAMRKASAAAVGLAGRAGFQRNLLLAERLLENRTDKLAFPMFRALLGQLRSTPLTQWEPAMGARCIRGYLECARSSNAKIEDERELIDELMLLDPSLAVGLF